MSEYSFDEFVISGDAKEKNTINSFISELNKASFSMEDAPQYIQKLENHKGIIDLGVGQANDEYHREKEKLEDIKNNSYFKRVIEEDSTVANFVSQSDRVERELKQLVAWLMMSFKPMELMVMRLGQIVSESRGLKIQSEVMQRLETAQNQRHELQLKEMQQLVSALKGNMDTQQDKFINTIKYLITNERSKTKELGYFMKDLGETSTFAVSETLKMLKDIYEKNGNKEKIEEIKKFEATQKKKNEERLSKFDDNNNDLEFDYMEPDENNKPTQNEPEMETENIEDDSDVDDYKTDDQTYAFFDAVENTKNTPEKKQGRPRKNE